METVKVSYEDSRLDQYRSLTHDSILIYGFTLGHAGSGKIIVKSTVKDGLGDWASWGSCSVTCGIGTRTRARTCQHMPANANDLIPALTDSVSCNPVGCKLIFLYHR